ncbi:hypothetical protein GQ57_37555 [Burkholderia sp. MSh2]|nr:hypothetical protein GQ57_37555 [Burkholderia sp. MSh2]
MIRDAERDVLGEVHDPVPDILADQVGWGDILSLADRKVVRFELAADRPKICKQQFFGHR